MSPHYLQTACKHRSGLTLCANKKIQAIPMKAATGNHQIMSLPIVSQRPKADG